MAQTVNLKLRGWYTAPNNLSAVPEGGCEVADNVEFDTKDTAEPERGYEALAYDFPISTDRANRLVVYQGKLIAHHGASSVSWYDSTSGWQLLSNTISPPATGVRLRFFQANNNLYMTTSNGIYKMDAYNVVPFPAGSPKALDTQAALNAGGAMLPNNTACAYRILWGYRDLNNNVIRGAPSQRAVVTNTSGGARDVDLTFSIPDDVTTAFFYQVYRAAQVASSVEPSDEMALVYEANPTAGQITAGTVTVTDSTPESLRNGEALYTSPSQETAQQANDPPPYAKDATVYRGFTIYGNIKGKHNRRVTLVGVAGTGGIDVADTVTVGGVTFTGAVAENIALNEFEVFTAGTPSQNIADTAQSLVKVVNRSATSTVYAYYVSGFNSLPGSILFERKTISSGSFTVVSNAPATAFSPQIATAITSTADEFANGLAYSKGNQPEAVPPLSREFAGSQAFELLRVIALSDSVPIFKEDGYFNITGLTPQDFVVSPRDPSLSVICADSCDILGESVYALTNQGVAVIATSGEIRSLQIEDKLQELIGTAKDALQSVAFGVGYDVDRKYRLYLPATNGDSYPTQCFVYNIFTNCWHRSTRGASAAIAHPSEDKLYIGRTDVASVSVERKSFTSADFYDEALTGPFSITAYTDKLVTLSSLTGVSEGDLLYQVNGLGAVLQSVIVSVDVPNLQVTVEDLIVWDIAICTVFPAITSTLVWVVETAGNPAFVKQAQEVVALFRRLRGYKVTLSFKTDYSGSYENVQLEGAPSTGWGTFPWGSGAWGGTLNVKPLRCLVPAEKQYFSQLWVKLTIRVARLSWKLEGIGISHEPISIEVQK